MPSGAKSVSTFCLERKLRVIIAGFLSRFFITLTVSLMGLKRMNLLGSTGLEIVILKSGGLGANFVDVSGN